MANSGITTHTDHPPPATLQRGIITEIDNVKKFLSETFPKHATPSDVKGQTQDCVRQDLLETQKVDSSFEFCVWSWHWSSGGIIGGKFVKVGQGLYESKLGNLLFPFTRLDLVRREQITWSGKQTRYLSTNNWAFAPCPATPVEVFPMYPHPFCDRVLALCLLIFSSKP